MSRCDRLRRLRWLPRLAVLGGATLLTASCFGSSDTPASTAPSNEAETPVSASPTPTPDPPPENGVCRQVSVGALRTIVNDDPTVPCKRKHTTITYAVSEVPASAAQDALSAADERVEAAADRICLSRFTRYVGGNRADRRLSMLTPTYFLPSSEQWNLEARWVRCDIYAYATPTRLADLPADLKNALEREKVSDKLNRCSPVSPSAAGFRHVACSEPHDWRAVAIQSVGGPKERYPGRNTVQGRAQKKCEAPVRDYLGTQAAFSYGFEVPQRDAWAEGDRVALCWARTSQ
jgi:Septum formation